MPTLRDVGEFEALRRLTRRNPRGQGVVIGPGDDAAVLEPRAGRDLVATTDALVEGRHFLPAWLENGERGARLAAANLSDLAAMAATPRWALLSAGVRAEHDIDSLLALQDGLARALGAHGAVIAGGNLTAAEGPEWFALTLLGEVERGRMWTRRGARLGDLLVVTGFPGRAGAGCQLARTLEDQARRGEWQPLMDAWLRPSPRVTFAVALAMAGTVTAAIDVSDGVASDLAHLCEASGVGAEIDEESVDGDPWLERAARALGVPSLDLCLGASDDYELMLAIRPDGRSACEQVAAAHDLSIRFVGRITDAPGSMMMRARDGARRTIQAQGFDHFRR